LCVYIIKELDLWFWRRWIQWYVCSLFENKLSINRSSNQSMISHIFILIYFKINLNVKQILFRWYGYLTKLKGTKQFTFWEIYETLLWVTKLSRLMSRWLRPKLLEVSFTTMAKKIISRPFLFNKDLYISLNKDIFTLAMGLNLQVTFLLHVDVDWQILFFRVAMIFVRSFHHRLVMTNLYRWNFETL